jgi:hypothetical protein
MTKLPDDHIKLKVISNMILSHLPSSVPNVIIDAHAESFQRVTYVHVI